MTLYPGSRRQRRELSRKRESKPRKNEKKNNEEKEPKSTYLYV